MDHGYHLVGWHLFVVAASTGRRLVCLRRDRGELDCPNARDLKTHKLSGRLNRCRIKNQ